MDKSKDYGGPFRPTASWDDFSRETLLDALSLYSNLFLAVDGFWYLAVKESCGDDAAIDRDLWVWNKYFRYECRRLTKLLNITTNDIEAFLKITQFSPWAGALDTSVSLLGHNHGKMKVTRCPVLEGMQKEGQGRERHFCRRVETKLFDMWVKAVNPDMTIVPLRLPPDTRGTDVCCEWDITL